MLRLLLLASLALPAVAAEDPAAWPSRPIRFIVTYPPGGGTDIVARIVMPRVGEILKQPIVIDNRGGAGGTIGTELAARTPPDGYTLVLSTTGTMVINPLMNAKPPYDPNADFAAVSMLVVNPLMLVATPSANIGNVAELLAAARRAPGKLNYASVGVGSPNHLAMEVLKSMAGVDLTHVPYKGAGPAITDIVGGQVQVMFNPMPALVPYVKAGKLRALAVSSTRRSAATPDVPTVAEAGIPGFGADMWYGVAAPARTPAAIVARLNAAIASVLGERDVAEKLLAQGAEPRITSVDDFNRIIRADIERTREVIRAAKISASE